MSDRYEQLKHWFRRGTARSDERFAAFLRENFEIEDAPSLLDVATDDEANALLLSRIVGWVMENVTETGDDPYVHLYVVADK